MIIGCLTIAIIVCLWRLNAVLDENYLLKSELSISLNCLKTCRHELKNIFKHLNSIIYSRSHRLLNLKYATIYCSFCNSEFYTKGCSKEFLPYFCCYCGGEFSDFSFVGEDDEDDDEDDNYENDDDNEDEEFSQY